MSSIVMPDPKPIPKRSKFARLLLDKGFSPNTTGSEGGSLDTNEALWWAARHGLAELVETLIDTFNADVESKVAFGATAIHLAAVSDSEGAGKVLKILARAKPGLVLTKDGDGNSALHLAALCGSLEKMEILRSLDADILALNDRGATILHMAVEGGHCDIIRLLVNQWNANIDFGTDTGISPLQRACHRGHLDAVKLLVELGAAINKESFLGSALHSTADGNHPSIM